MLTPEQSVFVLVDVQGRLAQLMHEKEALFGKLQTLVSGMKALAVPIIWVEQIPRKMGRTIEPLRALLPDLEPIPKSSFSCCGEPVFSARLREEARPNVLVAGIETHVCVYQTVRDLMATGGHHVEVVADAVSSRTASDRETGLSRIRACGASLTSVETLLFELMQTADHPAFRDVLRLVK